MKLKVRKIEGELFVELNRESISKLDIDDRDELDASFHGKSLVLKKYCDLNGECVDKIASQSILADYILEEISSNYALDQHRQDKEDGTVRHHGIKAYGMKGCLWINAKPRSAEFTLSARGSWTHYEPEFAKKASRIGNNQGTAVYYFNANHLPELIEWLNTTFKR